MNYRLACLLSALIGYVSLSQEIIWFRLISYTTGGAPKVFAHVLGTFLLGIAAGAYVAGKRPPKAGRSLLPTLATTLTVSSIVYYLSIPATAQTLALFGGVGHDLTYFWIFAISFCNGLIFPLLCHAAISPSAAVGGALSRIYFWNIVGSVAGPLLTTFVLMDYLSLGQIVLVIAGVGLATALLVAFAPDVARGTRMRIGGTAAAAALVAILGHATLFDQLLGKFQFSRGYTEFTPYLSLVETRSGVVSVAKREGDYWIYGGGIYDGKFNTDPVKNSNGIRRGYMAAALHRTPKDVLEIGLSSGSWSRVLADLKSVETLTIVEINPGYEQTIKGFPEHATVLTDPKVAIAYDDGRRWLNHHADRQFDFILMNTTYHWRSMITGLLSEEFLRLCKQHLTPGGVLYYNTTGSPDVIYTAAQVFSHVVRIEGFVAASDAPFDMSVAERKAHLLQFEAGGTPVFGPARPGSEAVLETLAATPLPDVRAEFLARRDLLKITDDNMATEYKTGVKVYDPGTTWARVIAVLARK